MVEEKKNSKCYFCRKRERDLEREIRRWNWMGKFILWLLFGVLAFSAYQDIERYKANEYIKKRCGYDMHEHEYRELNGIKQECIYDKK